MHFQNSRIYLMKLRALPRPSRQSIINNKYLINLHSMSKMYILFFYYKDLILLFFVDQDGMLKNIKKFKS